MTDKKEDWHVKIPTVELAHSLTVDYPGDSVFKRFEREFEQRDRMLVVLKELLNQAHPSPTLRNAKEFDKAVRDAAALLKEAQ